MAALSMSESRPPDAHSTSPRLEVRYISKLEGAAELQAPATPGAWCAGLGSLFLSKLTFIAQQLLLQSFYFDGRDV